MGWKKFILGEKMPDKDDPKYQKQYETDVRNGRKFAEKLHIDVPFRKAQEFANRFPAAFLTIVFGFVIVCLCLNIYRMTVAFNHRSSHQVTASERQQQRLREVRDTINYYPHKPE